MLPSQRVSQKQLLAITSQLSTMLASGCDLCAGLEAMAKQQHHPRLREILLDLHDTVESGQPFSVALAKYPDVFNAIYVTMARAGESAGLMRQMLGTLQSLIRNQIRVSSSVRSALMYPMILCGVACVAVAVMVTFVLPRFAGVFKAANAKLPTATLFLLGSAEFMAAHWQAVFLTISALVGLLVLLLRQPAVKLHTHIWFLRIPLIGGALQLSYVVRSIQTLGMLIKAGLPLAESLVLVRDLMPNIYYRDFFDELRVHISEGKALAPDFDRSTLFPAMVSQMMAVGEQTGTLPQVCLEAAGFHEEELQDRIKLMTTAIEPIIIILLGGFVGFIAVSVILPMFQLSNALK